MQNFKDPNENTDKLKNDKKTDEISHNNDNFLNLNQLWDDTETVEKHDQI